MRRREFLCLLGCGIAASLPCSVAGQQTGKVYRLAVVRPLGPVSDINETDPQYGPFLGELRRLGYIEGQNLAVERVSAEGRFEHYREVVSAVVRSDPDAVFAFSAQLTLEFKAQTSTIPIVGGAADPVASGIVPSLARPGGNITGIAGGAGLEPWGKRLALLKEVIPTLSRVGMLIANTLQGQHGVAVVKEAADKVGLLLVGSLLESPFDEATYRRAFAAIVREGAEAIYTGEQQENWTNRRLIVELADQHRLPAMYSNNELVRMGGLMAYTADWPEVLRQAADQIDQIFKGAKPSDIPWYQSNTFHLAVNLKTAKTLGIEIPNSLLAQADEVIE
jgi:putative ABC transport system substrate-binding protein